MPSNEPPPHLGPPGPRRPEAELLAGVIQRGRRLRQRRQTLQRGTAGTAVVTVLALLAVQLGSGSDEDRRVVAASPTTVDTTPATTDTPSEAGTTTTTSAPEPTTADTATTDETTTTTAEALASTTPDEPVTALTTTTTEPPPPPNCRNSTDPACGPTYWDPPPGPNQPLTVEVTHSPAQPQPGEEVTFQVTVTDPDARITRDCNFSVNFGDGNTVPTCYFSASCVERHGPHTPPDAVHDRYETTFTHTYQGDGDFNATFEFESSSGVCYDDPYASRGQAQAGVSVRTK